MPAIDRAVVAGFIAASEAAENTTDQGSALENLIEYLFGLVPGVVITHRNALNQFKTEEIDVAIWNDGLSDGFHSLPTVILIECKNWTKNVGSAEVAWFDRKIQDRGLDFGILIATRGITGDGEDLTRAHMIVAGALQHKRRLIVIKTEELMELDDTDQLTILIKKKICELTVQGAIS